MGHPTSKMGKGLAVLAVALVGCLWGAQGAPTAASSSSGCAAPVDLTFLVDKSASIKDDQWVIEKEFVEKMVGRFQVGPGKTKVALSLFANHIRPKWCFDNYTTTADVVNAVKNLDCPECNRGKTGTGEALKYAREKMFTNACGARAGTK